MGRRRGKRHASSAMQEAEGVASGAFPSFKRQRCSATDVQLSREQEDRLGHLSSSLQWVIKIAQDRGSDACLALQSCVRSEDTEGSVRAVMKSVDDQEIELITNGTWASTFARVCSMTDQGKLLMLSGLGARLSSSGSEIIYDADKLAAELFDSTSGRSIGSLEIVKGKVLNEPALPTTATILTVDSSKSTMAATEASGAVPNARSAEGETSSPEGDESPAEAIDTSSGKALICEKDKGRTAKSGTPPWLRTPAVEANTTNAIAAKKTAGVCSEASSSNAGRSSTPKTREPQQLGTRMYTPISLLECNDRKPVNVIGLITTDHSARRALSGTRDWKITIGLIDVEGSKDASAIASNISFNLFAPQETDLPRCKPASIVLLQGVKIRPFNGYPQGNGYPGQHAWAVMDTSEGNNRQALTCSDNCVLSEAEKKELKRQYDWYRKRHKGQLQPTQRKSARPLIALSGVEREVFFDTTVEILKIWSNSRPAEVYVTDYTTHPLFYAANDVHLDALSREELAEQQEDSGDAGNGRVLPISLWDDQHNVVGLIQVGMLVRLENVRPKMQPNGFLGATMSGSREEKVKVIHVKETKILEDFARRKQDYLEDVALKRAERIESRKPIEVEERLKDEERSDAVLTSGSSTVSMPPPGQRPLAAIENCSDPGNRTASSGKSQSIGYSQEEEEKVLTLLEEFCSSITDTSLEDLDQLKTAQLKQGDLYVCEGRVFDMMPSNISEIAEVVCGLCNTRLPPEHSFCAKCAEEDGKDLQYRFNFALLIESTEALSSKKSITNPTRIALLVRGEAASKFLHGFHPKDVRNRASTMKRLQRRLLPLLGSKLVYGEEAIEVKRPLPFRFAVRAHLAQKGANPLTKRFSLTSTRLIGLPMQ